MLMTTFTEPQITAVNLVEAMTTDNSDNAIGYRMGRENAGPRVIVAGYENVADPVYDRLIALPTLGWMRGQLTMVFLDRLGKDGIRGSLHKTLGHAVDEVLFLPMVSDCSAVAEAIDAGYWSVLQCCKRLGMIDGRGVYRTHEMKGH